MADSLQVQIEDAVVSTISGLGLSGVPSTNVKRYAVMEDRKLSTLSPSNELPAILVSTGDREEMSPDAGTNTSDDITYPVLIVILNRANRDQTAGDSSDDWLYWRQLVAKAFHNKRLSGVSSVMRCVVSPGDVRSLQHWISANLWVSSLMLKCTARVARS